MKNNWSKWFKKDESKDDIIIEDIVIEIPTNVEIPSINDIDIIDGQENGGGGYDDFSSIKKKSLVTVAKSLYAALVTMDMSPLSPNFWYKPLDIANGLGDKELKYVAVVYRLNFAKNRWHYLYTDIDNLTFPLWKSIDTELKNRLNEMGEAPGC